MAKLKPKRLIPESPKLAEILPLLHRCFAYMEGRIDPPSSLNQLTPQKIKVQAADHEIWTLGSPVFACVFLTEKPNSLYLGKLAVAPEHRGQGIAKILIDHAQCRAQALGLGAVELQTRIELVENQIFFKNAGFVETAKSTHPGYIGPTSVDFCKVLS